LAALPPPNRRRTPLFPKRSRERFRIDVCLLTVLFEIQRFVGIEYLND